MRAEAYTGGGADGPGDTGTGAPSPVAVPARAALVGNPSDAYGGAVLAATVPALTARVRLDGPGPASPDRLSAATIRRFEREFTVANPAGWALELETTIPRSVGLGGSSAIVLATLRALCAHHGVHLEPGALAELALSIEADDLGIAAGLQDRLVQAHGGLVFMEFGGPSAVAESLDAAGVGPLLVAWRMAGAEDSGIVHTDLRERWDRGEAGVREAMSELGALARSARAGLNDGDPSSLGRAMAASFAIRRRLLSLDPRHVELVDIGTAAGAWVNYTGSGGAVVCLCTDPGHRETVARAFAAVGAESVAVG